MPGGRFFGFVIGGTHPAALAADWLVSAWDQNTGLRGPHPGRTRRSRSSPSAWLLDLLGLPAGQRGRLRHRRHDGQLHLPGRRPRRGAAPGRLGRRDAGPGRLARAYACSSGAERHDTIDLALRYLGLGAPEPVAADDQGRIEPAALAAALEAGDGRPTIVCLQAGNVHSGAFDPFARGDRGRPRRRRLGARRRRLRALRRRLARAAATSSTGVEPRRLVGHRRPQDPQRALRLRPRDRPRPGGAAGGDGHARRLPDPRRGRGAVRQGPRDQPPRSRRSRCGRCCAALGRDGVADLVDGFCDHAARLRRRHRRDRRRRGAQRRRLHPGVRELRRRRPHPRGRRRDARRRDGVDDRLAVARPGGAARSASATGRRPPTDVAASLDALRRAAAR